VPRRISNQFEAEVELELYREYRAVFSMFRYAWRPSAGSYLATNVKVTPKSRPVHILRVELVTLGLDMYAKRG